MKFTGQPVLIVPQKSCINIGFQADMTADITFGLLAVMASGIDIGMTCGIQQIMSDKSQNISVGNLLLPVSREDPWAFQKMS